MVDAYGNAVCVSAEHLTADGSVHLCSWDSLLHRCTFSVRVGHGDQGTKMFAAQATKYFISAQRLSTEEEESKLEELAGKRLSIGKFT